VIGLSPAEVAAGLPMAQVFDDPDPLLAGFVGLPMSEAHRRELIASLQTAINNPPPGNVAARQCLLNLLEEDGRCDEALAILRDGPHESLDDGIREVRLLWQAGKQTEAGGLALRLGGIHSGLYNYHSPVWIDLIRNRKDRALVFLTFLEEHAVLPPEIRYGLALHHLDLARRRGDAIGLIEPSRSPVLRAVWNVALGKMDQALACLAPADSITRTEDLELLLISMGQEPLLFERSKILLRGTGLTVDQRVSLLQRFTDSRQCFELWAGMSADHGATAWLLGWLSPDPSDPFSRDQFSFDPSDPFPADPFSDAASSAIKPEPLDLRRICLDILSARPDDARLQLLAAQFSAKEPDHGKPLLLHAATAVRAAPEDGSRFPDPATGALRMLVPLSDAAELDKLLLDIPGFEQLHVADRLRYQMAAELDTIVVDAFAQCKLDQPSQDALSGMFAGYFSQREIPPEALAMVLDRLLELVCGSPARKSSEIANLASCWLGYFSYQVLPETSLEPAVKRLLETAVLRGPEVLREVRSCMPQPLMAQAGVEADIPDATPATLPAAPLWWLGLAIFAPADPVCGDRHVAEDRRMRLFDRPFMNGQPFVPTQMPAIHALLSSPWEQNISGLIDRDPSESQAKAILAAKLRNLFEDNPSRTVIYDLLVSTGTLPCPDPETKVLADRGAATIGNTPQDDPAIDFYLFLHRLANREPLDQALAALKGLQEFPLPTRSRLMMAVGIAGEFLSQFPGAHEALMAQLALGPPVKPKAPEPPKALTAYDRLHLYQEAGTTDSPECIALAREVLFKFVESKCPNPESTENLAIAILVQTGKFEGFLADMKSRMAEADDHTPLQPLWNAAKDLLAKAAQQDQAHFLAKCAAPVAKLAEDAVWAGFLTCLRADNEFAAAWLKDGNQDHFASLPPQRQHDLARIVLSQLAPDAQTRHDLSGICDALLLADPPDRNLLRQLRPWLEASDRQEGRGLHHSPQLQLLDLLDGDPAAISPTVSARQEGKPSWKIEWSLAGYTGYRTNFPAARRFPFLDGRFDLQILAGPTPERLARVASIDKAAFTGVLDVRLPDGARFISLLASEHDGAIIRWAHPVALDDPPASVPVELAPVASGKPGAAVKSDIMPTGGPFFLRDATDLTAPPGATIELAQLPWTSGAAPVVSGWILLGTTNGGLQFSYRTAENIEVGTADIEYNLPDLAHMPFWRRFTAEKELIPPPETERIALVFHRFPDKPPTSFRIADLRVVPPKPAPEPAGFISLGRIPGAIKLIAVDPGSNRFAAASDNHGLGVFDFASRRFAGWIPLGPTDPHRPDSMVWMALAGDHIVGIACSGDVHLVSIAKRTSMVIGRIVRTRFSGDGMEKSIKLSPDGDFLAWAGSLAGVHLVRLGDDGAPAERVLETGQVGSLRFNTEPATLEAMDGENRYLLPLANWEKALLQTVRDDPKRVQQEDPRKYVFGDRERLFDPRYQVTYEIAYGAQPIEMKRDSRHVDLPPGLVVLDQQGHPFHISASGQIHRIETTRLKGYQAPTPQPSE